jgi:hypothetical protein
MEIRGEERKARPVRRLRSVPSRHSTRRFAIRCESLFRTAEDLALLPYYVALIVEHSTTTPKSDDEVYEVIVAHWHRGVLLLLKDLERTGSVDKFVAELAHRCVGTRRAEREPGPRATQTTCLTQSVR